MSLANTLRSFLVIGKERKRARIRRRLKAVMRPDPDYRERKLAQFTPERRARYFRNVEGL